MILSVMLEKHLIPFVLLGYICVSYLALPTMAIALMGAVFALIQYYSNDKNTRTTNGELLIDEEDFSNGI